EQEMKPTYEELERERNELAARVERLRVASAEIAWSWREDHGENDGVYHDLMDALSETPPTSLAALKAQWQAEYEHCDHNYARFGDQPHRRCIKCDKVERA